MGDAAAGAAPAGGADFIGFNDNDWSADEGADSASAQLSRSQKTLKQAALSTPDHPSKHRVAAAAAEQ
eukprot:gene9600-8568_t